MLSGACASILDRMAGTIGAMGTIGDRVRAARSRMKLSQSALAQSVGVTRSAISQLENGITHDPRPDHLMKLARALRIGVDELVYGTAAAATTVAAAEPTAAYAALTSGERLLLEYIRGTGGSDAMRDRLAHQALALLLAIAARPVDDSRLGPNWAAPPRKRER